MITKRQIKFINSLQQKKFRKEHNAFIVQGTKSVLELIAFSELEIELLVHTEDFIKQHSDVIKSSNIVEVIQVSIKDLERVSTFDSNSGALAVVSMKKEVIVERNPKEFVLVLDDIRDPGNLGTIIRIADWYGVKHVICSQGTADFYNPKVISSTMGSFMRVNVVYKDLDEFLSTKKEVFIGGALLDGQDIYNVKGHQNGGYIVIGNESKGISDDIKIHITNKITIPRIGNAESLNAGIATAIFCDNLIGRAK